MARPCRRGSNRRLEVPCALRPVELPHGLPGGDRPGFPRRPWWADRRIIRHGVTTMRFAGKLPLTYQRPNRAVGYRCWSSSHGVQPCRNRHDPVRRYGGSATSSGATDRQPLPARSIARREVSGARRPFAAAETQTAVGRRVSRPDGPNSALAARCSLRPSLGRHGTRRGGESPAVEIAVAPPRHDPTSDVSPTARPASRRRTHSSALPISATTFSARRSRSPSGTSTPVRSGDFRNRPTRVTGDDGAGGLRLDDHAAELLRPRGRRDARHKRTCTLR